MSDLQLLFWGINAVVVFVLLFVALLIILWIVNKWILKGKIGLLYRIMLAIGIPLVLVAYDYYSMQHSFYSTSNMDRRLERIGVGITLPSYEITSYKNEHVMADDFMDTYQMVFKDSCIKSMISKLDSVCNASDKWSKMGDEYVFHNETMEEEHSDTLTVHPYKGTATFVRYKW
jgi:hypothetical protein